MWILGEAIDGNTIEFWTRDKNKSTMELVFTLKTDSGALGELKSLADKMNALNLKPEMAPS